MWIDSSIVGFRSAIRKFGIDRYKKNCVLATQVTRKNYLLQLNNTLHTEL